MSPKSLTNLSNQEQNDVEQFIIVITVFTATASQRTRYTNEYIFCRCSIFVLRLLLLIALVRLYRCFMSLSRKSLSEHIFVELSSPFTSHSSSRSPSNMIIASIFVEIDTNYLRGKWKILAKIWNEIVLEIEKGFWNCFPLSISPANLLQYWIFQSIWAHVPYDDQR